MPPIDADRSRGEVTIRSETISRQQREFRAGPPCHVSLQLLSNSGELFLKGQPYRLTISRSRIESGETDADGCLTVAAVPGGDYLLELPRLNARIVVSAVPVELEHVPTRVQGAMPCGRGDALADTTDDADSDSSAGGSHA